jgi:hypothetical protein
MVRAAREDGTASCNGINAGPTTKTSFHCCGTGPVQQTEISCTAAVANFAVRSSGMATGCRWTTETPSTTTAERTLTEMMKSSDWLYIKVYPLVL